MSDANEKIPLIECYGRVTYHLSGMHDQLEDDGDVALAKKFADTIQFLLNVLNEQQGEKEMAKNENEKIIPPIDSTKKIELQKARLRECYGRVISHLMGMQDRLEDDGDVAIQFLQIILDEQLN